MLWPRLRRAVTTTFLVIQKDYFWADKMSNDSNAAR